MGAENKASDEMYEAVAAEEEGDYERAFILFQKLALQGDSYAMSALARFYEAGTHVEFDLEKSIEWDEKAISAGENLAMLNLAITYRRHGKLRQAREWLEKAIAAGDPEAALELAKLYMVSDKEESNVLKYLQIALQGKSGLTICEASFEEAEQLLEQYQHRLGDEAVD